MSWEYAKWVGLGLGIWLLTKVAEWLLQDLFKQRLVPAIKDRWALLRGARAQKRVEEIISDFRRTVVLANDRLLFQLHLEWVRGRQTKLIISFVALIAIVMLLTLGAELRSPTASTIPIFSIIGVFLCLAFEALFTRLNRSVESYRDDVGKYLQSPDVTRERVAARLMPLLKAAALSDAQITEHLNLLKHVEQVGSNQSPLGTSSDLPSTDAPDLAKEITSREWKELSSVDKEKLTPYQRTVYRRLRAGEPVSNKDKDELFEFIRQR